MTDYFYTYIPKEGIWLVKDHRPGADWVQMSNTIFAEFARKYYDSADKIQIERPHLEGGEVQTIKAIKQGSLLDYLEYGRHP